MQEWRKQEMDLWYVSALRIEHCSEEMVKEKDMNQWMYKKGLGWEDILYGVIALGMLLFVTSFGVYALLSTL